MCVCPVLQDASVSFWSCGAPELLFKSGMWEYFLLRDVTTERGNVGLRRAALTAELLLVLQPR